MKQELKQYLNIAEAITKLLHPFAEVVLHDIQKGRIEAIFNPFSKREIGDLSYLEQLDIDNKKSLKNIIAPYEKTNYDGRKLKSISIIIRNQKKVVIGLLCINLDISIFYKYKNILNAFLSNDNNPTQENIQSLFKDDLYEQINIFARNYCLENNLNIDTLNRHQKRLLILKLKQKGALLGKNATNYIARIFNISRATVYNYLKEEY